MWQLVLRWYDKKKKDEKIMKKMIGKTRETMRQYWSKVMASTRKHMSIGAQHVDTIISWARRENWRGNREKKK